MGRTDPRGDGGTPPPRTLRVMYLPLLRKICPLKQWLFYADHKDIFKLEKQYFRLKIEQIFLKSGKDKMFSKICQILRNVKEH